MDDVDESEVDHAEIEQSAGQRTDPRQHCDHDDDIKEPHQNSVKKAQQVSATRTRCGACIKYKHFPNNKFCRWALERKSKILPRKTISSKALTEAEIYLILKHIRFVNQVKSSKASMMINFCEHIIITKDNYWPFTVSQAQERCTRVTTEHKKLQGGAKIVGTRPLLMVNQAIESGKKHGIHFCPGVPNNADGNCAFESVINNINYRSCYKEKLLQSTQFYRHKWITDLENHAKEYPSLGAGFSDDEKKENWNRLKQSGVYEIEFFGDYVIYGIAMGCRKNILIFNTSKEAHDPIYTIEASKFGGIIDTDIPIVLAYNQVHYESLHPVSDDDIEATKRLFNLYKTGNYAFLQEDIPNLVSNPGEDSEETQSYDENFPPLAFSTSKQSQKTMNVKETNNSEVKKKRNQIQDKVEMTNLMQDKIQLEEIKRKKPSERTNEEKKRYTQLRMKIYRANKRQEEKDKEREASRIGMRVTRARKTPKEKEKEQEASRIGMKVTRARKTPNEKDKEQEASRIVKRVTRARKTQKEKDKEREASRIGMKVTRARKTQVKKDKEREATKKRMSLNRNQPKSSAEYRKSKFDESIKDGRIYECVSCHRILFKNGIETLPDNFYEMLENESPGLFATAIGAFETTQINEKYFICLTCKNYISKGKIPPMSNQNNLQIFDISDYPEFNLTELENCMIALNIIFQKVFRLPKSRWPAMKDRTVNIPIYEADIIRTVESLPRTPNEAGIIPINLKRKVSYKNCHITQYISVPKMIKALETLKQLGNRYYQFVPDLNNFKERCQTTDIEGFQLIFPQDELLTENLEDCNNNFDVEHYPHKVDDEICGDYEESLQRKYENEDISENRDGAEEGKSAMDEEYATDTMHEEKAEDTMDEGNAEDTTDEENAEDSIDEDDAEEEEYIKKDSVKKWQFQYNQSTCFSNNYPEISYLEENSNNISIAPGEGKLPSNLLEENDWDLKTFPGLLPDGKNSLHAQRPVKLSEQDYFMQRIMNKDTRFAHNPAYIFAAIALIEKRQVQRNMGISFNKGTAKTDMSGDIIYSLEDPFSVLDNIKNTPRYWQKARYELLAKLENHGPFTFFFTLSCADLRWKENFSPLLRDSDVSYDSFTNEVKIDGQSLEEFFQANENKHEFIKKNLLNATLTFYHRVKMFIKHIVMSSGNPMAIKYYSYKVEFAMRGAGHIHGVLWIDWDSFCAMPKENLKSALDKIKNEEKLSEIEKQTLADFADLFISCSLKNPLTENIVRAVNIHFHTKTCRKYCPRCRFHFPRFPSLKTLISVPLRMIEKDLEKQKELLKKVKLIKEKVLEILEDDKIMEEIQKIRLDEIEEWKKGGHNKNELHALKRERLLALLRKANFSKEENDEKLIQEYEQALSVSEIGYRLLLERDVDEIFVNNYNEEWIINWDGNIDISFCFDFFAVITYISDYYGKDDSGTLHHIKEALKQAGNDNLKSKMSLVAQTFLTHRQIGECEAFFRILPHLHLKDSNTHTVFVATGFKQNRSKFLKPITKEEAKRYPNIVKIERKTEMLIEKPSLLDKYVRMDKIINEALNLLTYLQFSKKFSSSNIKPKEGELQSKLIKKSEALKKYNDLEWIVTHDFETTETVYLLPKCIKLTNCLPGEPMFMRLRKSSVARIRKYNQTKDPHEFYISELQLYRPFTNESELQPESLENCKALFDEISEHNRERKITNVKRILMEHLESVVEGTEKAQELIDSNVGDVLDPANEQDNHECEEDGVTEDNDFVFKNPDDIQDANCINTDYTYRKIELYPEDELKRLTRCLDEDQRIVLDKAVNCAMSIKKYKYNKDISVRPPLLIVQGGAGSGKSLVIDVVSQHVEKILRQPGDNPNHPYVLRLAFTGTAAANIQGQTLHSAFSFNFGKNFISLNDKSRDNKRNILENLMFVFIDEYSFIDSDMLYKLDLRLKELKQKPSTDFGGVALIFFGDILQLKPVRARYICEEPKCENFAMSHLLNPLWNKFEVVMLNKNHRQGEDGDYANILNRIRKGNLSEADLNVLKTRVRALDHPDIPKEALIVTCINNEVNRINSDKLAEIYEQEYTLEAINRSQAKNLNSLTDSTGAIRNTPLQKIIKLKIGAKVVLTFNVDTCDSLTNGSFGEVIGVDVDKTGEISAVIVHFYDEKCGHEKRKNHVNLQNRYPGKNATPIKRMEFHYTLSKSQTTGVKNAFVTQFPLRLAFAATAHKVQGQTVKKPNSLVIDLRTVREAAQAYVMLSRVQSLGQLFILDLVPVDKIYSSYTALEELERLKTISLNDNKKFFEKYLISCNVRSLAAHYHEIASSPQIKQADLVCLQETWLTDEKDYGHQLKIPGFNAYFCSAGSGKGVMIYCKENYKKITDIRTENHQILTVASTELNVINIYKSPSSTSLSLFLADLIRVFDDKKETLIVGDFNICFKEQNDHPIIRQLKSMKFNQRVKSPTHVQGRCIDHVYHFSPNYEENNSTAKVLQFGQFYTDHDMLLVEIPKR